MAILGGLAANAGSSQIQPVYEATTSVLVGQVFEDPNISKESLEATQSLTDTYADIARRQPILEDVVNELQLRASWPQLAARTRVLLPPSNPQLILIIVEADSPEDAETIANEIAARLVASSPTDSEGATTAKVKGFVQSRLDSLQQDIVAGQRALDSLRAKRALAPPETRRDLRTQIDAKLRLIVDLQNNYSSLLGVLATEESPNSLRILETAGSSGIPVRPDLPFNTALGAGAGLFFAMGLAYALEFRNNRTGRHAVTPVPAPDEDDAGSPAQPSEYQSASVSLRR